MGSRKLGVAGRTRLRTARRPDAAGPVDRRHPPGSVRRNYVKAICTAVGPFEKDVAARSNALNSAKLTSAPAGQEGRPGLPQLGLLRHRPGAHQAAGSRNARTSTTARRSRPRSWPPSRSSRRRSARPAIRPKSLSTTSPQSFKNGANKLGSTVQLVAERDQQRASGSSRAPTSPRRRRRSPPAPLSAGPDGSGGRRLGPRTAAVQRHSSTHSTPAAPK